MNVLQINNTIGQAQRDYQHALRQAFWRKARAWLGRSCNDLLSFAEVFDYLKDRPQYERCLQNVPVQQIVGSTGRSGDFDLAYFPVKSLTETRWVNVAKERYQGNDLPPVRLYKVGKAYFVEDGNHRVSVASVSGKPYIDAYVIEIDVSHLTSESSCKRLGYKLK